MKITALLLIISALLACQPTPEAQTRLDDYLTRLSRVLDVDVPALKPAELPRMPAHRSLRVAVEPLSINLVEFWGFRECGLAEVLGERNSILGRVMVPSQHLHMDGRILQQLRYCIDTLEDDALVALASDLRDGKQQQWPARYWNATAAAPELRAFWSPATSPLTPGEEASFQRALTALGVLSRLPERLRDRQWPNRADLETHYRALEQYALGGALLQSLDLGRTYIEAGNEMLERARRQSTLCPAGLAKRELEYARNVMVKVFVAKLQPWLAAVNQRATNTRAAYTGLLDAQSQALRQRLQTFETEVDTLHGAYQTAIEAHVAGWQNLFESCGSKARP